MRNQWYVAAESAELREQPLARRILGEPIALFRDERGQAAALVDVCPHRNAPLSGGRVQNGRLMCPYHGWEFDTRGQCAFIPSLVAGEAIPARACTPAYPLVERDGYVWVWVGDEPPGDRQPLAMPHHGEAGWGHGRLVATIHNAVEHCIENFIDCPHTGYIHGGLFRQPASHRASTHVRAVADGVVIDIEEEQQANSLLGRLLVAKGQRVTHQDRFILPSTVQVAYGFGPGRSVTGLQLCTPVGEFETRVYVYVTWQLGWLTPLVRPFVPWIGRQIMAQDVAVLERQAAVIRERGSRFTSAPADTANLWIQACRQRAADGLAPLPDRDKRVEFRL